MIRVTNDEVFVEARGIAQTEGLLIGISSGAAAFAAKKIALRPENRGKPSWCFFQILGSGICPHRHFQSNRHSVSVNVNIVYQKEVCKAIYSLFCA